MNSYLLWNEKEVMTCKQTCRWIDHHYIEVIAILGYPVLTKLR